MRILQVGYTDQVGKRFNGAQLHRELVKRDIVSEHAVWEKTSRDSSTWKLSEFRSREFTRTIFQAIERRLRIHSLLYPFSWTLAYDQRFRKADLVHFHLINAHYFSLLSLPLITRLKQSVWTLHDPWAFTGNCIHPLDNQGWKTGCRDCTCQPWGPENVNRAFMWQAKRAIYRYSYLDLVVASRWMKRLVAQSPLLSGFRCHLIPFGIDLQLFRPRDAIRSKRQIGIPAENMVVTLRATPDVYKGFQFTKECLHRLNFARPATIISFGQRQLLDEFKGRYQVIDLGWVDNDELLVTAYNATDVFLMPSVAESFGMMSIEAMACGRPVLAFDGTALEEVLFVPKGGMVVPQGDTEALTLALENLLNHIEQRRTIGATARRLAVKHYNELRYVQDHLELYCEIINRKNRKILTAV